MAWEKYSKVTRQHTPAMSFKPDGVIGLNAAAVRGFGLYEYAFVELAWDRKRQLVGLTPTNDPATGGMKMSRMNRCAITFSGRGFCTRFGLNPKRKKWYPLRRLARTKTIVADLNGANGQG